MKKIWSYLAVGFAFFSAGLLAMYKIMGEQVKVTVRKVKNKGISGSAYTNIPIDVESRRSKPKRARKKPKRTRKQKRIDKQRLK